MSLDLEFMESYALQITAVREGTDLFMKRRIRPNLVDKKIKRPLHGHGLRVQVFKAEDTKGCGIMQPATNRSGQHN